MKIKYTQQCEILGRLRSSRDAKLPQTEDLQCNLTMIIADEMNAI
jgi:hypothetical protein